MCNLYRLTSNVEAMRRLFAVDPAAHRTCRSSTRSIPIAMRR